MSVRAGECDVSAISRRSRTVCCSQIFWSERGAWGGVLAARLDGGGARWLLRARLRRPTALALSAPAGRLYVLDAYYGVLESVALDGSDRAAHVVFRTDAGASLPPHVDKDKGELSASMTQLSYPINLSRLYRCSYFRSV